MNCNSVIRKLNKFQPASEDEFEEVLERRLTSVGSGVYRESHLIEGTDLIVKFPLTGEDVRSTVHHSRREIDLYKHIMRSKSLRRLRKYLPKMYYHDYDNGIIVMERVFRIGKPSFELTGVLEDLFMTVLKRKQETDIGGDNTGYDRNGKVKVVDLGII